MWLYKVTKLREIIGNYENVQLITFVDAVKNLYKFERDLQQFMPDDIKSE